MSATVGQAILAMFESDLLTVGGEPIMKLMQSLVANKGNVLADQAAWLLFLATAPSAGITLGIELEQQLLSVAITKLQAAMAMKIA